MTVQYSHTNKLKQKNPHVDQIKEIFEFLNLKSNHAYYWRAWYKYEVYSQKIDLGEYETLFCIYLIIFPNYISWKGTEHSCTCYKDYWSVSCHPEDKMFSITQVIEYPFRGKKSFLSPPKWLFCSNILEDCQMHTM